MILIDAFRQVFLSFNSNRFKTIMSSLGIIIGVVSIIVMLSIGEGLQAGVGKTFSGMNIDTITIYPGNLGNLNKGDFEEKSIYKKPAELRDKDIHELENIAGIKTVLPRTVDTMSVKFRDEERSISIVAIDPTKESELMKIDKGRFLIESDKSTIVIDDDIANNMFKTSLNPGMRMSIYNKNNDITKEFSIVGILKEKEKTSIEDDTKIYVTHQALKDILNIKNYSYSQILVVVDDQNQIEDISKKIEESLKRLHKDEAYTIFMMKSILEGIGQILAMIKFALGGIGTISLIVGGIGIVNVMMLTVTERIKEIGIMKAVGASQRDIQMIFILESGLIGFISSLIGIIIGSTIAMLISMSEIIPIEVTWKSILIALSFGIITTISAGFYPANKASKLDPVEALRSE